MYELERANLSLFYSIKMLKRIYEIASEG